MEFVVYVDREGSMWPPPERPPGDPVITNVQRDSRFGDAIAAALRSAGPDVEGSYYFNGSGPHYVPRSLRDSNQPHLGFADFPRVVITEDGQLLWMQGAKEDATFEDFERAREAGYFDGDPYGVFLERPMYGDGIIPGWEEVIGWLAEAAVGATASVLVALLRKHYRRWRDRGATTPYAYLDIVLARDSWNKGEFARFFGLSGKETTDLLTSLGFRPDDDGSDIWSVSPDPDDSQLRKKILHDFLHRPTDDDQDEAPNGVE